MGEPGSNPVATRYHSRIASRYVEPLGNAACHAIPLGSFYLYGQLFHDSRAKRAALRSAESLLLSNLLTQGMKHALNRERPGDPGIGDQWRK